jgi:hypothetical protein
MDPTAGRKKRKSTKKKVPKTRRPTKQIRQKQKQSQRVTINFGNAPPSRQKRAKQRREPNYGSHHRYGPIVIPVPQPYPSNQPYLQQNERALPAFGGGAAIGPVENVQAPSAQVREAHDHSAQSLSAAAASVASLRHQHVQSQLRSRNLSEARDRAPLYATNPSVSRMAQTPMREFSLQSSPNDTPSGRAAARPLAVQELMGRQRVQTPAKNMRQ